MGVTPSWLMEANSGVRGGVAQVKAPEGEGLTDRQTDKQTHHPSII